MSPTFSTASCTWAETTARSSSSRAIELQPVHGHRSGWSARPSGAVQHALQRTCATQPARRNIERRTCRSAGKPLDLRAAGAELLLEPLEAAVEVIDAVDRWFRLRPPGRR